MGISNNAVKVRDTNLGIKEFFCTSYELVVVCRKAGIGYNRTLVCASPTPLWFAARQGSDTIWREHDPLAQVLWFAARQGSDTIAKPAARSSDVLWFAARQGSDTIHERMEFPGLSLWFAARQGSDTIAREADSMIGAVVVCRKAGIGYNQQQFAHVGLLVVVCRKAGIGYNWRSSRSA